MSAAKPFSLPVQLVKTQIYIQKLKKKQQPEELYLHLDLLKAKYEWIRNPVPVELQSQLRQLDSQKKKVYSRYDVVIESAARPAKQEDAKGRLDIRDLELSKAPAGKSVVGDSQAQPAEDIKKKVSFMERPTSSKPAEVPTYDDPMALLNPDGSRMEVQEVTPCEFCGRRFGPDAMARHVKVCMKNPDRKANVKQSTVKK